MTLSFDTFNVMLQDVSDYKKKESGDQGSWKEDNK